MILGRILGNITATIKHPAFHGESLMIVQPVDHNNEDRGGTFLAIDRVQSGPGDRVLVLREGNGVRQIVDRGPLVPIRSAVIGIVDTVEIAEPTEIG